MDWRTLRRLLRDVAEDLDRKLSRMPTGEYWKEQFRTREIASLVASQVDGPPTEEERQILLDIFQFYIDAESKAELRAITRLRSFRNLRTVLREFVTPEETRLRLRLQATSLELQRQLVKYPNGDRWWNHLALPDVVYIHEEATESQTSAAPNRTIVPTASDFADLQAALDRYDSVSQDARYRIIADLPAFHSTQVLLSEYIRAVQPQLPEPPSAAEELPTPAPEQQDTTNP